MFPAIRKENGETTASSGRWRSPPGDRGVQPVEASVKGVSANTTLIRKESLFADSRERAVATGDTRPDTMMLTAMEDHAEAMAREQDGAPFDPERNFFDREILAKNDRAKQALAQVEDKITSSNDDIRKRRDAAAHTSQPPERPSFPLLVYMFGAIAIALTIAPTLHDFIFIDVGNSVQTWFLSLAAGLMLGFFIASTTVSVSESGSSRLHWMGFLCGVLIGIALFLIRCLGIDGMLSLLMAIGLALLEIAFVVLLEWTGRGLRRQFAEYREKRDEHRRLLQYLGAAEEELTGLVAERMRLTKEIGQFVEEVGQREAAHLQIESLVRGARQAVRDGYYAGIAENEGRARGCKPRKGAGR